VFFYPNYKSVSKHVYYLSAPTSQKFTILIRFADFIPSVHGLRDDTINLKTKKEPFSRAENKFGHSPLIQTLSRRADAKCDDNRLTLGPEQAKALQHGTAPVPRTHNMSATTGLLSHLRRLGVSIGHPDVCGGPRRRPCSGREWISTARFEGFP
jgi:hypothetical protein